MKHKLLIHQGENTSEVAFSGAPRLQEVLFSQGLALDAPCGGRGICGKCAVRMNGAVSPPNQAEQRLGTRLFCQAVLLGDVEVWLPPAPDMAQIQVDALWEVQPKRAMAGKLGAAIDVGTTTLALRLYDLKTGALLASVAGKNPQTQVASDVMGRIGAALLDRGEELQSQVTSALSSLLRQAAQVAQQDEREIEPLVVTGNTAMLYLLCGRTPQALARKPFKADHLFDEWTRLFDKKAYLPPCMDAFVGADLSCAVLFSGMCAREETALLVDVGTNGELALWHGGKLYVSSTAAGPAFEGAGIHLGSGSVQGAVDRVWLSEDGQIKAHVIGEGQAQSICGSGLIDAIACLLKTRQIDETGASEQERLFLTEEVYLLPRDVRNVQLAKAAIAAGILTLCNTAGLDVKQVDAVYLAGGFGSHLNLDSAEAIGLLPRGWAQKTRVLGNAALAGAAMLLLSQDQLDSIRALASLAVPVPLGGQAAFNEAYIEQMLFNPPDVL